MAALPTKDATKVKDEKAVKVKDDDHEDSDSEEEWDPELERMPGQKKATPSPGDGTRVFYETLLQQRPDSFIGLKYCVEHGIIRPKEKAQKALTELNDKKSRKRGSDSPVKSEKAKKARIVDTAVDDDALEPMGYEGIGRTTI